MRRFCAGWWPQLGREVHSIDPGKPVSPPSSGFHEKAIFVKSGNVVPRPVVVVHATPVGGSADPDGQLVPDWDIAPGTYVLDMVYQNPRTPLLRAVAAAGGVPVSGLGMFLAQAREQIYHFTGRRLPLDGLVDLVGWR